MKTLIAFGTVNLFWGLYLLIIGKSFGYANISVAAINYTLSYKLYRNEKNNEKV